jgi:hypothetical protein
MGEGSSSCLAAPHLLRAHHARPLPSLRGFSFRFATPYSHLRLREDRGLLALGPCLPLPSPRQAPINALYITAVGITSPAASISSNTLTASSIWPLLHHQRSPWRSQGRRHRVPASRAEVPLRTAGPCAGARRRLLRPCRIAPAHARTACASAPRLPRHHALAPLTPAPAARIHAPAPTLLRRARADPPARLGHSARHCSLRAACLRTVPAPAALARMPHAWPTSAPEPARSSSKPPPHQASNCRPRLLPRSPAPASLAACASANSRTPAELLRPTPAPAPGCAAGFRARSPVRPRSTRPARRLDALPPAPAAVPYASRAAASAWIPSALCPWRGACAEERKGGRGGRRCSRQWRKKRRRRQGEKK